jgi:hypothetical protein
MTVLAQHDAERVRRWFAVGLAVFFTVASVPARGSCQTPQSAVPPSAQTADPVRSEPTAYALLVDRLKAGDRTVDFTELRIAFTETPSYHGMMMGFYQPLWRTLNQRDFERAIEVADRVLQQNYAEPNAHMVAAAAHRALEHRDQAEFHQFVADGLLRSITTRGDGLTAETAYQVIDISEEYALFRSLNLTVKSQGIAGTPVEGKPIVDRIVVVAAGTTEERVIFFSVDNPTSVKRKPIDKLEP